MKQLKASRTVSWALRLLFSVTILQLPGILSTASAQTGVPPPPDCVKFFAFTADGSGSQTQAVFDNRSVGCTTWTVVYQATGTGSITGLTFQSAGGAATAGSYGTYAGTVLTGSANPMTSSTGQVAYFANETVATPWLRVSLAEGSFVGVLNGVYYGYRTGYQGDATSGGGGGGGGGGCSSMTPCVVIGPDAVGVAPTQSPTQTSVITPVGNVVRPRATVDGDFAGANALSANQDAVPNTVNSPVDATLQSLVYNRVLSYLFNGSTYDRAPGNTLGSFIQGKVAAGVAITQNPVVVGLASATGLARNWLTGNALSNTAENGTGEGGVINMRLAGTGYNKEFACNLSSPITVSAATDVVIAASGGGSLITRICGIYFSSGGAAAVTIRQGTGTTCLTNTVDLTGAFQNVTIMTLDFRAESALQNTVAARDTCLHFSTSVTAGGVVQYAQFTN